jgi:amino acid permease
MTTRPHSQAADADLDDDARHLAELRYTQELHRGMSAFSNFAVSFSIISILAGCITSYGIALRSGGPSTLVLGWLIVGVMVLATVSPVTVETFNYAPVAVLVVLAFATISWFVGGRHSFMLAAKDEATSAEAEKVLDS